MSKFLVIDTATTNSHIALLVDGSSARKKPLKRRGQTEQIIPFIKELLCENGLSLKELTGIAVCIGPGLFTGTRVGVMTAKSLSYAADVPLYPFTTFDLFEGAVKTVDAKCGRAYVLNDGSLSLVSHRELSDLPTPVHTLESLPFKDCKISFVQEEKNLSLLETFLQTATPVTHDKISIIYPD